MIFTFSGTGNSSAAAKAVRTGAEQLVEMAKANQQEEYQYTLDPEEAVGFVFPVYFYGLPDTVRTFASRVTFSRKPAYVYAVITCGGSVGAAGSLLKDHLAAHNIVLQAVYTVRMPDNYILLYPATNQEEEKPILEAAEKTLAQIRGKIQSHYCPGVKSNAFNRIKTAVIYPFYDITRKTVQFHVEQSCRGCGACAARCPSRAIEMREGKPVWIHDRCDHCLSCLRCSNVQYGRQTRNRYRYEHPDLRKM